MTSVLSELPTRLHHNAYVCADQERTRHFYEDIVGLPLVATWIEQGQSPDFPGREISFAHTFFAIGDGGAPGLVETSKATLSRPAGPARSSASASTATRKRAFSSFKGGSSADTAAVRRAAAALRASVRLSAAAA